MTASRDEPSRGVPARMAGKLTALAGRFDKAARRLTVETESLQSLHRWMVGGEMKREAAAVAAGKARYAKDHQSDLASYFLLRRNVHRLEKGLIMRPRRATFAADYIQSTVKMYVRARRAPGDGANVSEELSWAADVLDAYFSVVDNSPPRIAAALKAYREAPSRQPPATAPTVPYARDLSQPSPVSFEDFMSLSRRRRSVRWYLDKAVPRDLIDQAVGAAGQSPSACNRQPFRFRIFDDKIAARRIASIPMGTKGFAEFLPAVAVVVGRLRAYPLERDRHTIYVDGALAAMSLMYALETLGLSTCPINWPDVEVLDDRMTAELGLEPDERVIMLIALGWPDPDGLVPYSAKRPLEELRQYG